MVKGKKPTMDMSVDSPGDRHQTAPALPDESLRDPVDGNRFNSWSSNVVPIECGMRQNEGGSPLQGLPTSNVCHNRRTGAKTLVCDIGCRPSSERAQLNEPLRDISNRRSRKPRQRENLREKLLKTIENILRKRRLKHPEELAQKLCDEFRHFEECVQYADSEMLAVILRQEGDLHDLCVELESARTHTQEEKMQLQDEILALEKELKVQNSSLEHEPSCVTLTPGQENANKQVNAIYGSYTDDSATPKLLDTALSTAKAAVTRFQKLVSQGLESRNPDLPNTCDIFFARSEDVKYLVKSVVYRVCFEGFENESFNTLLGVSKFLDTGVRQARFYEYYQQGQTIAGEDPQFEEFCRMKLSRLSEEFPVSDEESMQVSCLEERGGPQLGLSFRKAAKSVWLLHKLAFSFEPPASIFRVERGAEFDPNYMYAKDLEDSKRFIPKVGFMIAPGLRVQKSVLHCEVYFSSGAASPD